MDVNNGTTFGQVKVVALKGEKGDMGDSGDYAGLINKPSINGVQLNGDQSSAALNLASQDEMEQVFDTLSSGSVATLFTGVFKNTNASITLEHPITDYNFIDIYYGHKQAWVGDRTENTSKFIRIPADDFPDILNLEMTKTDGIEGESAFDYNFVTTLELTNNDTLTITDAKEFFWAAHTSEPPEIIDNIYIEIYRIDGIIIDSGISPELENIRIGANGTVYPTAGDAVRGQITDVDRITVENSDEIVKLAQDTAQLSYYKVPQPVDKYNQPVQGENGQLLRTDGNGNTEWVDEGLPTDEQTAQAVTDWLDEHPEATTTVEDGSLTNKKLVEGTLGFVTPQMYKTDSGTDWTDAFSDALNSPFDVFIPKGTYHLNDEVVVSDKSNFTIWGEKGTIIYPDSVPLVDNNSTHVFSFFRCNDFCVKDLTFISDCDQVGRPPSGHTRNTNLSSNRRAISTVLCNDIVFQNLHFKNMESDFWLNNALEQNRTQNITIDGWTNEGSLLPLYGSYMDNLKISNSDVYLHDYSGDGDHVLYISATNGIHINNCNFNLSDNNTESTVLLAFHGGTTSTKNVYLNNVNSYKCERFIHAPAPKIMVLENCTVKSQKMANANNGLIGLATETTVNTDLTIKGCDFEFHSDAPIVSGSQNYLKINIDDCVIKQYGNQYLITAINNFIINNSIIKTNQLIYTDGSSGAIEINRCNIEADVNNYLLSVRDGVISVLLTNCFIVNKQSTAGLIYAGGGTGNINNYSFYNCIINGYSAIALTWNNHGGTLVNSYLNGTLLVPQA